MTSLFSRRAALLAAVLVCIAGSTFAQDAVAGHWTLDVDSPEGMMKAGLVLTVDGQTVKGAIASEMGEASFTGTVKDGAVTFTFGMSGPQGLMTINATATVSGDDIKGEMDYGMGVAPFTGKRTEQ